MHCPFCNGEYTQVSDSRVVAGGTVVRRRRRCSLCGKRFTTHERLSKKFPQIVKRSGVREEYDRKKLESSMMIALRKRSISAIQLDEAIMDIESSLVHTGEREVSSRFVGEQVMRVLFHLDRVAWVRFASVYHNFDNVHDFQDSVAKLGMTDSYFCGE
ncbi:MULTISPECIES: transcriptional regulator NrdR [Candidatus Ichthyocystis]|uniref:Transcriptional repressor NrdR n=1 Tax=Candidatus Ichthyocystis hellenicum TaxID=1561003 RepID=A0A0S4M6M3_9BURK|nr:MULTISPECIES: transcriptional regulator NrdR [Ichthyocystis]CUT17044.1 Transcriptional repressor NrdR family [Candidatus Ichthyocystis hellenicum]